jgi:hypothetical protein
MSEETCKKVAQSLGLKIGGAGFNFAGDYEVKGLYAYSSGSYKGLAFFGTGGTPEQIKSHLSGVNNKYRPNARVHHQHH